MVFKLIRTDSENPSKIPLPTGNHLIGRGKFLDCEDKRISRNHGNLNVTDDIVTLKALHLNPCFFIKKNAPETQILKLHSETNLTNGDKFGLLPDSYWYEVLLCTDIDLSSFPSTNNKIDNGDTEDYDATTNQQEERTSSLQLNESLDRERSESPSLIPPENQQTSPVTSKTEQVNPEGQQSDAANASSLSDAANESTNGAKEPPNENRTPKRRDTSNESDFDQKKIKLESPEDVKPNTLPGSSSDQQGASAAPQVPPSPQKQGSRERCIYGANCYRRNPQHLSQFSHPADADWGAGSRGQCPWGATCRRRDPRHWQHHDHPPGTQPPAPGARPGRGAKRAKAPRPKKKDSDEEFDSDSSENAQALIVTGKRQRKPVNLSTDWKISDDEENEDPYQTDESDEWQPSNNDVASSQYTQDYD